MATIYCNLYNSLIGKMTSYASGHFPSQIVSFALQRDNKNISSNFVGGGDGGLLPFKIKTPNATIKISKRSAVHGYDIGAHLPTNMLVPLLPDHLQFEVEDIEPLNYHVPKGRIVSADQSLSPTHQSAVHRLRNSSTTRYDGISVFINGYIPDLMNLCAKCGVGAAFFETHKIDEKSEWWFSRAIIATIYVRCGFAKMLAAVKGECSIILMDSRPGADGNSSCVVYVASDRIGSAPIYKFTDDTGNSVLFTNANTNINTNTICPMPPGLWESYRVDSENGGWKMVDSAKYFSIERGTWFDSLTLMPFQCFVEVMHSEIRQSIPSNKKVVCMLSGGLFSTTMAIILSEYVPNLTTCFVGEKNGAKGMKSAAFLAERLGTNHINILVDEYDFCRATGNVVFLVQTAEVHTVRDGCVHYIAASKLRESLLDEDVTVFLGDGGENIFREEMNGEVEDEYDRMFGFGGRGRGGENYTFTPNSPKRKPQKMDKKVQMLDKIYRHMFGFPLRFPYFTSKIMEFVARHEFSRSEMVEWLEEMIPDTYSEYYSSKSPIASAMPIGILYGMTVNAFSKMDEQSYYNELLAGI